MATLPVTYLNGVGLVKKSNGRIYVVSDPVAVGQFKVSGEDGIIVDEDGYLKVDFSKVSSVNLTVISEALIQEGGGLAVDEDGHIYVDFSTMPTDKFEELLKSIRVPIWLEQNTTFYVNSETGSDDNDGLTESTAFKTIQAAYDYIADNYNLSAYTVTIQIADGTYDEVLNLGSYSATTGTIRLVGNTSDPGAVVINCATNPARLRAVLISTNFNTVYFRYLTIKMVMSNYTNITSSVADIFALCVARTVVYLYHCNIETDLDAASPASTSFSLLYADDNAVIHLMESNAFRLNVSDSSYTRRQCLYLSSASCILDNYDSDDSEKPYQSITGDFTNFILLRNSYFNRNTTRAQYFNSEGDVTGARYHLVSNSGCATNSGGEDFFPGDTSGYLESSSYCWYT